MRNDALEELFDWLEDALGMDRAIIVARYNSCPDAWLYGAKMMAEGNPMEACCFFSAVCFHVRLKT